MNVNYGNQPLDESEVLPYQFTQQSYKKEADRENVGDFEYDADLSNVNTAVYHNQKTKKTHVSNRGSVSARDWFVSDLQVAAGAEDYGKRFQDALHTTWKAHDKYGYNVTTSGHSLGGTLSAYETEKLGNEAWYDHGTSFNMGSSPLGTDNPISERRRTCGSKNPPAFCNKMTNIKQSGDYISRNAASFGNTKTYHDKPGLLNRFARFVSPAYRVQQNFSQHSLKNFSLPT